MIFLNDEGFIYFYFAYAKKMTNIEFQIEKVLLLKISESHTLDTIHRFLSSSHIWSDHIFKLFNTSLMIMEFPFNSLSICKFLCDDFWFLSFLSKDHSRLVNIISKKNYYMTHILDIVCNHWLLFLKTKQKTERKKENKRKTRFPEVITNRNRNVKRMNEWIIVNQSINGNYKGNHHRHHYYYYQRQTVDPANIISEW